MSKKSLLLFLIVFAVLIFTLCFFALEVNKNIAFANDDFAIVTQPENIDSIYGSEEIKPLKIVLNETNAVATYVWYKSKSETSAYSAVENGSGKSKDIVLNIKKASESGFYKCKISSVTVGENSYDTEIWSNVVRVNIVQKEIEVKAAKTEFTYNGQWQKPIITIKADEIIDGDTVTARTETLIATKNAGSYNGTIKLDNPEYKVKGSTDISYNIKKAPLTVKVKEVAVRMGKNYSLEIEYDGLIDKGEPTEILGFTPTIPNRFYGITNMGSYEVFCEGKSETENYVLTYAKSTIFVNSPKLEYENIIGVTATAGGSFREGTKISFIESDVQPLKFHFLKPIKYNYDIDVMSGKIDGETFTINIEDDSLSSFMLAVCESDKDGKTAKINNYSYNNGVLSVTINSDFDGSIVIYHNYTLIVCIGALLILIILVIIIVKLSSLKKYKRQLLYCKTAEKEANKYR